MQGVTRSTSRKTATHLISVAILGAALAGCASTRPVAYSGIASSPLLAGNARQESDRIPYRYTTAVDWQKYTAIIVDRVDIYRGADQQFADVSDTDKAELAQYMQNRFAETLKTRFSLASAPAHNTLRLKLTLTGAETTTPFLGPFLHLDLGGNLYNSVQAARGREGAQTGSVMYAVEIFDAQSNRLLQAYVTKQYPHALNIGASFGALTASKTGIDKGAELLLSQLR